MINTALVFDHRGRVKKGELGPIEVRVTISRKPYYINTGVRVYENEWKYGCVINHPDATELNERLKIITNKVEREINYCIDKEIAIDVAQIRKNIFNTESTPSRFEVFEWMNERIGLLQVADGTRSHYTTMLNRLMEFGIIRRWSDVNVDVIYRWDAWLHKIKKPQTESQKMMGMEPELITDSGVYNYHKTLKRLLSLAEKARLIDRNPYTLLRGEFRRGDRENVEYLTEDEMNAIIEANIQRGSHLDMVRDLFVVQMFTGMAYADLVKFDIAQYKEVDGKWVSVSDRVKTGVAYVSQLLPPVVNVLMKYGWKLPKISNQVYNRSLKDVGEKSGISTPLHSHLARHTFATFMLGNGVKVENLQRMMGHTDIKMTQRYAKTLAQSVHDEFDMIAKKIKKRG